MNGNANSNTQKLVFVFKSTKDKGVNDKYEEILAHNSIPFEILPVLSFEFVNKDVLTSVLLQPNELSAVILTSTQAVHAVISALKDVKDPSQINAVLNLQCFVVGHATYDAAVTAGFQPEGEDTGNADNLAIYILKNVKDSSKLLLFPCSSIRRESIPKILKDTGLSLKEIISYETHPDEHIQDYVKKATDTKGLPDYTVFFSPSGFKHVCAVADKLSFVIEETKIIALGPVTAAAISEMGYDVHGTAEKPDPEGLLNLIQKGK